jgi:hypothetical protein
MVDPATTPTPPSTVEGEVEDVVPEGTEEEEDLDDDLDSFDEGAFEPMHHLTQLLVTESGTPLVDVVQGIQEAIDQQGAVLRDALEKLNRIMYKLVSVIENKSCPMAGK